MTNDNIKCGFDIDFIRDIRECQLTKLTFISPGDVLKALREINNNFCEVPKLYDEIDYQWLIYIETRFADYEDIQELVKAIKYKIARCYEDLIYAESYYLYPESHFRTKNVTDYMLRSRKHISGTKLNQHFCIDLDGTLFDENKIKENKD